MLSVLNLRFWLRVKHYRCIGTLQFVCIGTSLDACDTKAQGTQTTPSGADKSEPQLFGIGTFSEPRLLTW